MEINKKTLWVLRVGARIHDWRRVESLVEGAITTEQLLSLDEVKAVPHKFGTAYEIPYSWGDQPAAHWLVVFPEGEIVEFKGCGKRAPFIHADEGFLTSEEEEGQRVCFLVDYHRKALERAFNRAVGRPSTKLRALLREGRFEEPVIRQWFAEKFPLSMGK